MKGIFIFVSIVDCVLQYTNHDLTKLTWYTCMLSLFVKGTKQLSMIRAHFLFRSFYLLCGGKRNIMLMLMFCVWYFNYFLAGWYSHVWVAVAIIPPWHHHWYGCVHKKTIDCDLWLGQISKDMELRSLVRFLWENNLYFVTLFSAVCLQCTISLRSFLFRIFDACSVYAHFRMYR